MFIQFIITATEPKPLHLSAGAGNAGPQFRSFRAVHLWNPQLGRELMRVIERAREIGEPARALNGG